MQSNPPLADIDSLDAELLSIVKSTNAFSEGFTVFSVDDFDEKRNRHALPVVGVAYEGCAPAPTDGGTNVSSGSRSAVIINAQFTVIIAIQYDFNSNDAAERQKAHRLLSQTRRAVQGFKGVNTRPWRFVGEQPLPDDSGDGVVYYAQVWQTALPSIGNFA